MTETVFGVDWKFAISVIGAFMVTVAGFNVPEYEPAPDPDQLPKLYPPNAPALTWTDTLALYQPPDDGATTPAPEGLTCKVN